jgi:hypothetical protein
MKLGLTSFSNLVALISSQERARKLRKLEADIEQASTDAELNKLDKPIYHEKMSRVHLLQYNYLIRKGKYYQFGIYDRGKQ